MVGDMSKITPPQMSYLLHMVTVATRRKFDNDEGSIWLHLLSDFTYDECHEAFTIYLREQSTDYLTPALITQIIKDRRRARWVKSGDALEAPNGLTGKEYLDWLHGRYREITAAPKAPQPPSLESGQKQRPLALEG